jgi:hypothetical protein
VCVDAYQIDGDTTGRTTLPSWRPFHVDALTDVTVLTETFECAPGLNIDSPKYMRILAHCMED